MSTHLQIPTRPGQRSHLPDRPHPAGDKKVTTLRLLGGAVGLWALLSLIGLLVTHVLDSGRVHKLESGVDNWFAAHRTGTWNTITVFGNGVANTETVIAVTVVTVLFLRWRLKRWCESWIVVTAITGELLVFLTVTATVHRPRLPAPRLDVSPPTSSFPSGHTAAGSYAGCL
jgi:undecaprenyl-diphosphatase